MLKNKGRDHITLPLPRGKQFEIYADTVKMVLITDRVPIPVNRSFSSILDKTSTLSIPGTL